MGLEQNQANNRFCGCDGGDCIGHRPIWHNSTYGSSLQINDIDRLQRAGVEEHVAGTQKVPYYLLEPEGVTYENHAVVLFSDFDFSDRTDADGWEVLRAEGEFLERSMFVDAVRGRYAISLNDRGRKQIDRLASHQRVFVFSHQEVFAESSVEECRDLADDLMDTLRQHEIGRLTIAGLGASANLAVGAAGCCHLDGDVIVDGVVVANPDLGSIEASPAEPSKITQRLIEGTKWAGRKPKVQVAYNRADYGEEFSDVAALLGPLESGEFSDAGARVNQTEVDYMTPPFHTHDSEGALLDFRRRQQLAYLSSFVAGRVADTPHNLTRSRDSQ